MTHDDLLPGFQPSEQDLINRALAAPLDKKIERSIALIREYEKKALELSPDGYYLAFSGGKDSIVIKQLAIEAGVRFAPWYNNTTIDPPDLIYFMRQHHADVKWSNPKIPMLQFVKTRGLPIRSQRWCCEVYKEHGGDGKFKVVGVRISESARRAKLWKEFVHRKEGLFLAPISYWTDADVWEFIHKRNLPYCKLYNEGWKRIGCVGCPMAGKKGRIEQFQRYPRFEMAWKRSAEVYFNNILRHNEKYNAKYKNANEWWNWWMEQEVDPNDMCLFGEQFQDITGGGEEVDE